MRYSILLLFTYSAIAMLSLTSCEEKRESTILACPVCGTTEVKPLFSGASIIITCTNKHQSELSIK